MAAAGGTTGSNGRGAKGADDGRQPLLGSGERAAAREYDTEAAAAAGGGVGGLSPLRSAGGSRGGGVLSPPRLPATAPDPFSVQLLTTGPDGRLGFGWGDDGDDAPPVLLRRAASAGFERGRGRNRSSASHKQDRCDTGVKEVST